MELVVNGRVPSVTSLMRTLNISRSAAEDVRNQLTPPQNFPGDHVASETQHVRVTGDLDPAPVTIPGPEPKSGSSQVQAPRPKRQKIVASTDPNDITDPTLETLAALVHDLEEVRKATANRFQFLTEEKQARTKEGKPATYSDGSPKLWGMGLTADADTTGTVGFVDSMLQELVDKEEQSIKQLELSMKRNPLGPWIAKQTGLGMKQTARLLATIRDPYWNDLHDRPRKLSELWEFCGHGGPSQKKKGAQVTWSPEAKMRLWNISNSILKTKGAYRNVYDNRREETVNRVHSTECKRCGPSGTPAKVGSPWSKGHQHADALRIVGKEVLRDLWIEARRIHGVTE